MGFDSVIAVTLPPLAVMTAQSDVAQLTVGVFEVMAWQLGRFCSKPAAEVQKRPACVRPASVTLVFAVITVPVIAAGVVPPIAPGLGSDEVEPPKATDVPAIVIVEFESEAFATGSVATPPVVFTVMARAVAAPVPRPLTPVEMGNPVAFVSVPDVGVPSAGVTRVRLVAVRPLGRVVLSEGTPLPFVTRTALFTGEMNPVVLDPGWYTRSLVAPPAMVVAVMLPDPVGPNEPPVPTSRAAVLVPAVTPENATLPPLEPFAAAVIDPSAATVIFAFV